MRALSSSRRRATSSDYGDEKIDIVIDATDDVTPRNLRIAATTHSRWRSGDRRGRTRVDAHQLLMPWRMTGSSRLEMLGRSMIAPLRKRAAQALGLVVILGGCLPLGWGLSVWLGMMHYNFGDTGPQALFRAMALGAVPVGLAIIWAGRRLLSWGMTHRPAEMTEG